MNARKFTFVDDLHLIDYVQECPVLYDRYNNFSHVKLRDAWRTIAERMDRPEDMCKGRWRDMRDHYFKLQRKLESGDKSDIKWNLFDKLTFLDKVKRVRMVKTAPRMNYETSVSEPAESPGTHHLASEGACNSENDFEPEICFKVEEGMIPSEYVSLPYQPEDGCPRVDQPATTVSTESECDEENDVDLFLKSIAMTVKRFPPPLRAEAKLRILSVVSALEFPALSTPYTESVRRQ